MSHLKKDLHLWDDDADDDLVPPENSSLGSLLSVSQLFQTPHLFDIRKWWHLQWMPNCSKINWESKMHFAFFNSIFFKITQKCTPLEYVWFSCQETIHVKVGLPLIWPMAKKSIFLTRSCVDFSARCRRSKSFIKFLLLTLLKIPTKR